MFHTAKESRKFIALKGIAQTNKKGKESGSCDFKDFKFGKWIVGIGARKLTIARGRPF